MFEPLTEAELAQTLRELVIKKYDHSACDSDCESNAIGIQLLSYLVELRELATENEALRKALRKIEWQRGRDFDWCSACKHEAPVHYPHCQLTALLRKEYLPADATHEQVIGGREG